MIITGMTSWLKRFSSIGRSKILQKIIGFGVEALGKGDILAPKGHIQSIFTGKVPENRKIFFNWRCGTLWYLTSSWTTTNFFVCSSWFFFRKRKHIVSNIPICGAKPHSTITLMMLAVWRPVSIFFSSSQILSPEIAPKPSPCFLIVARVSGSCVLAVSVILP